MYLYSSPYIYEIPNNSPQSIPPSPPAKHQGELLKTELQSSKSLNPQTWLISEPLQKVKLLDSLLWITKKP